MTDVGDRVPAKGPWVTRADLIRLAVMAVLVPMSWIDGVTPRLAPADVAVLYFPLALLLWTLVRSAQRPVAVLLNCLTFLVVGAIGAAVTQNALIPTGGLLISDIIEAGIIAFVIARVAGPDAELETPREVVALFGAILVSCVFVGWLHQVITPDTRGTPFAQATSLDQFAQWALSDGATYAGLGAALLAIGPRRRLDWQRAGARRQRNLMLFCIGIIALTAFAFVLPQLAFPGDRATGLALLIIVIMPGLVAMAFYHGVGGAALGTLIVVVGTIMVVSTGFGPVARATVASDVYGLQLLLSGVAFAVFLIAALTADLRRTSQQRNEALAARDTFLREVTHELRTPLSGAMGAADLLSQELGDDAPGLGRVRMIRRSTRTMARVIEDIVTYTATVDNALKVEPQVIPALEPLMDAEAIFAPQAKWKGVGFRLDAAGLEDVAIEVDPVRLRQALFNLCANAVTWSSRDAIEITARLTPPRRAGEQANLTIVVQDSGPGMKPEQLAQAFEPYMRFAADDGSTPDGGTGLGLVIVRSVMRAMGGDCTLESDPGAGVAATLSLPVRIITGSAAYRAERSVRRRALLAEDDAITSAVLTAMLQSLGFDVVSVGDGVDALAALQSATFDVIVTDLRMPSMDGEALIETVRGRDGPARQTPIVVVTAHALPGDEQRLTVLGADRLCQKPVERQRLASVLSEVLPAR
jgi:signal transduction histidine kinase